MATTRQERAEQFRPRHKTFHPWSPPPPARMAPAVPPWPCPPRDLALLGGRILPALRALIRLGYFKLEVQGAEHLLQRGPVIYVANHAGWFTLDSLIGALAVTDHAGLERLPYGAVQDTVMHIPGMREFFAAIGGFPASWLRQPERMPPEMESFVVYPEGAEGNCKPLWRAYQMRPWRGGFLRLALARRAPIQPVVILGGEESLPVAWTVRALRPLIGSIAPLPLFPVPLPARWRVIFQRPIPLHELGLDRPEAAGPAQLRDVAERLRGQVQATLDREIADRPLGRVAARLARLI